MEFEGYAEKTRNYSILRKFLWLLGGIVSPNQITILRGVFAIFLIYPWMLTEDPQTHFLLLWAWGACWACDGLDGGVARARRDESDLGKMLDPLVDKIQFYGTILVFWETVWLVPLVILLVLDITSTLLRGRAKSGVQGAIIFGKIKTTCAITAFFLIGLSQVYSNPNLAQIGNLLIVGAIIFACISLLKRMRKSQS